MACASSCPLAMISPMIDELRRCLTVGASVSATGMMLPGRGERRE